MLRSGLRERRGGEIKFVPSKKNLCFGLDVVNRYDIGYVEIVFTS